VWILSAVVAVAGVWKLAQPAAAHAALRTLGLSVPPIAVRALGLAELAVGIVAVAIGGRLAGALLAVAYGGFAVVAERLRRAPGTVSCGCFGSSSAPPGHLHVAVNLAGLAVALAVSALGVDGFGGARAELPAAGLAHGATSAVGALAVIGLLTVLPEARAAASPTERRGHVQLFGSTIPVRGRP
jgi:hypothetical protein